MGNSDKKLRLTLDVTSPDRSNWYAGEWESNQDAWSNVFFSPEGLSLKATKTDKIPYLISKPIEIGEKFEGMIRITRRVRMKPGSDMFAGALVLFQTDSDDFSMANVSGLHFGEALFQVEYAANTPKNTKRPGAKDVFRVLVPNWEKNELYRLADPIYKEFFEEEIVYNTVTGKLVYRAKGEGALRELITDVFKIDKKYLRVWMHGYGAFTGHETTISDFEIIIEKAR